MTKAYGVLIERDGGEPTFHDGWYVSKDLAALMVAYFKDLYPGAV
jgi:hypothetical protein